MAFIPFPAGTVEMIANFTLTGIPVVITDGFYFLTGAAAVTDGQDLADELELALIASFMGAASNQLIFDNLKVNELSSPTSWTATNSTAVVGSVAADPVANQAAMVVTFNTAFRGRSFRGRNYIPGLPVAAQDSGLFWKAASVASIQSVYEGMSAAVYAIGWQHAVLSRYTAGAPRVLGVATDILSYDAKLLIGTQRGRLS